MKRREFIKYAGAAAVIWPLAARAQQPGKLPTVGILDSIAADDAGERMVAFRKGLDDAGYADGRNVTLVYRWAEYRYERLPAMALDLVRQGVDVILASGGDNSIQAAMAATKTIPVVFTTGNDPVSAGYVRSLNRPGGNATGMSFYGSGLEAKRVELLHEIDPKAVSLAVLMGSGNARTESNTRQIEGAAKTLGLHVRFLKAQQRG